MTTSPTRWLLPAILSLAMGCATTSGGSGGGVIDLRTPLAVDGDAEALAWPFSVAGDAGLTGFRLSLDAGGTLVAIRPDPANLEPAAPGWSGSLRGGVAVWSGPPPARPLPLTILVQAVRPGDQELRVRYTPTSAGDVSGWTCERWTYRIPERRIERAGC